MTHPNDNKAYGHLWGLRRRAFDYNVIWRTNFQIQSNWKLYAGRDPAYIEHLKLYRLYKLDYINMRLYKFGRTGRRRTLLGRRFWSGEIKTLNSELYKTIYRLENCTPLWLDPADPPPDAQRATKIKFVTQKNDVQFWIVPNFARTRRRRRRTLCGGRSWGGGGSWGCRRCRTRVGHFYT